jgi:hypothetical protein
MAKNQGLINWDEELAELAQEASAQEASTQTGQFFSLKSGVLSLNDAPMANNEMAVCILAAVLENIYYEGKFDADNPTPPSCYAFGRDEKLMKPHQLCVDAGTAQHETCVGCPHNEWGTSELGRGKACKNTRRLAMIPAGEFAKDGSFQAITDKEHYEDAQVAFMKLPVTSVKGFAAFVKAVAGTLNKPPFAIATKVKEVPDPKSQFKVVFTPLAPLSAAVLPFVLARHKETQKLIDFAYPVRDEEAPKVAKGKAKKEKPAKTEPAAAKGPKGFGGKKY